MVSTARGLIGRDSGSAVALFLFSLLIGITLLKAATIGRKVHYGSD